MRGDEEKAIRRRWPPRPGGRWLLAAALLLVVGVGAVAAAGWHFSSAVLVPRQQDWPELLEVERVGRESIVLARTEDSERPGVYGLVWQGGRAIVGALERVSRESVTRRLLSSSGYLTAEMEVAIDSLVYGGDPGQALGLPYRDVAITGELGRMPAWLVPGAGDTWAIVVHGINGSRQDGLRIAPTLRRAGLNTLLISYRDDPGAPSSPDGLHHMGLTEWRDVAAAARHALSRGARRLVLVGYSMGGAIVAQFMQRSRLADRVAGLVLDAPALDWREIISFHSTEMGLPAFASLPVIWAIGARTDVDWDGLDAARHPGAFQLPVLLFHGTEDDVVPISISDEFAAALPGRVAYHRLPRAGHIQAWNVSPRLYERRLRSFLSRMKSRGPG